MKNNREQDISSERVVSQIGGGWFITETGKIIPGRWPVGEMAPVIFDNRYKSYLPVFKEDTPGAPSQKSDDTMLTVGKRKRYLFPVMIQYVKADKKIYFKMAPHHSKNFYIDLAVLGTFEALILGVVEYKPNFGVMLYTTDEGLFALKFRVFRTTTGNPVTHDGEVYNEHTYDSDIVELNETLPGNSTFISAVMTSAGQKGIKTLTLERSEGDVSIDIPIINWSYDGDLNCEGYVDYYTYADNWGRRDLVTQYEHIWGGYTLGSVTPDGAPTLDGFLGIAVWLDTSAPNPYAVQNIQWQAFGKARCSYLLSLSVNDSYYYTVHHLVVDSIDPELIGDEWDEEGGDTVSGPLPDIPFWLPFGFILSSNGAVTYVDVYDWSGHPVVMDYSPFVPGSGFDWGSLTALPILGNATTGLKEGEEYHYIYTAFDTFDAYDNIWDAHPVWTNYKTLSWLKVFGKRRWTDPNPGYYGAIEAVGATRWPCFDFPSNDPIDDPTQWWNDDTPFGVWTPRYAGGGLLTRAMCRYFDKSAYWIGGSYKSDGDTVTPLSKWGKVAKELLLAQAYHAMGTEIAAVECAGEREVTPYGDIKVSSFLTAKYKGYSLMGYNKFGWGGVLPPEQTGWWMLADMGIIDPKWFDGRVD